MLDATEVRLDTTGRDGNVDKKLKLIRNLCHTMIGRLKMCNFYRHSPVNCTIRHYCINHVLYSLRACHEPGWPDTLFEEIDNANIAGDLSYDTIKSFPYLDAVIHETLRRHQVLATLERPGTKDYKLPDSDLVIKKGELIRLNAVGIFSYPEIYISTLKNGIQIIFPNKIGQTETHTVLWHSDWDQELA